jgi:sterol desaturase/sphingolipid hydroxylase (fatty acid hydroxylase superfamily)
MYATAFSFLVQLGFSVSLDKLPGIVSVVGQLIFFLLCEDLSHYWIHRWLHTDWAYKNIHYLHHEFTAPTSLAASYAHPLEIIAEGIGTFSGPLLVRPHFLVLFLWVNLRQVAALETHSGYDFPFSPNNLLSFFGGADLHDYHHRTYNGAYASNFIWWDQLFGTAKPYFASKEKQRRKKLKQLEEKRD